MANVHVIFRQKCFNIKNLRGKVKRTKIMGNNDFETKLNSQKSHSP